jgi:hypothetical protein
MEIVAPERRLMGYTTKPLVCPFPDLPPIVGYARTVTIRATANGPQGRSLEETWSEVRFDIVLAED